MRHGSSQNRLSLTLCPAIAARITVLDAHQADRTHLVDCSVQIERLVYCLIGS